MEISSIQLETKIKAMESWLKTQNHLPQQIEKLLLKRFLLVSNENVEVAQIRLENNFKYRNLNSDIFLNRDPLTDEIKNGWKCMDTVILPDYAANKSKIIYTKITDSKNWNFQTYIKNFTLINDIHQVTQDKFVSAREIIIVDMSTINLQLLRKLSVTPLRILLKFTQELNPSIYTEIHYINCSPLVKFLTSIVNPFLNKEIRDIIHCHQRDSNSLYDFIPITMLPYELGGHAGKICDLKNEIIDTIEQKRDYLIDEKYWKLK